MSTTLAAELAGLAPAPRAHCRGQSPHARPYRERAAQGSPKSPRAFPVYRTYVTARGVSETDRRYIDWAVKSARRASRIADPSVFEFVRSVLTLEAAPRTGARRRQMLEAMRFQQLTAPVVAKGVEDTAFYRYQRLIALNEVGGDPRFGFSLKAFHARARTARGIGPTPCSAAPRTTPSAPRTRARIGVLSGDELGMARPAAPLAPGEPQPSHRGRRRKPLLRADEYHFYQALIGIWPDVSPPRRSSVPCASG